MPSGIYPRKKVEPLVRFREKWKLSTEHEYDDTPCWEWTGAKTKGYGCFWNGQKRVEAHRWSYEHFVGPIPDGLELDHLCRVPGCVNPSHTEAVTHRENIRRGESPAAINARKTHCPCGLPFNYVNHQGRRTCSRCYPEVREVA